MLAGMAKLTEPIFADIEPREAPVVGVPQRSQCLRAAPNWLFAFFSGGLATGGAGGAFGLIFSVAGLPAGGIGMT
jgi:hypothetical protein